ncbi:carbohydrate ABC transporter permease [Paenibacillus sepulcri]|uniref:Carbohydrate ABC transporter permease n=1 Tax=Paenibacillus sepulcri TaxID=359917 RepID=A0ABS7C3U7_9BACL|nr:carbohydrate ABC transporter permease [Paenibacillus sepulcri]
MSAYAGPFRTWLSAVGKLLLAVLVAFPIIWMVLTSLKTQPEAVSWPPGILPEHWQWSNYASVNEAGAFVRWYLNSFIVAISIIVCNLVFGVPAAFAFSRANFPGRGILFFIVLSTLMIPGEILLLPLFILLTRLGWIDSYPALIVPFAVNGFIVFLLKQFFDSIPRALEEAAIIDGCGPFRLLRCVFIPLSLPALAVAAFFSFIGSWNSYLYPLMITRTEEMRTVTVGLSLFKSEFGTNWPLLMTASTLIALPAVAGFLFIERHLKDTMAISGIKE